MQKFLKTAARITGSDYARLSQSGPYACTKVQALALAVFVPTLLWGVFGFLLSYGVLGHDGLPSLIVGILLGSLIFILERLIVMGNGSLILAGFRVLLGMAIAFLGAQLVDLVIFKTDIENKLPQVKHAQAMQAIDDYRKQFTEKHEMEKIETEIGRLDVTHQQHQRAALDESSGLAGSGIRGAGTATKFKQDVANTTLAQKEALQKKYDGLLKERADGESRRYEEAMAGISNQSILLRIKAMEMLLANESAMRHIYWGFTALMFMLEFLVILFKLTLPNSAYDEEVAAIDALQKQRLQRMYGNASPLLQPHNMYPNVNQASKQLSSSLNSLL